MTDDVGDRPATAVGELLGPANSPRAVAPRAAHSIREPLRARPKEEAMYPNHIVYLVGMMRSGSTLVAEYLGSYGNAACVGELINTWRSASKGQMCSCGNTPSACPWWSDVFANRSPDEISALDEVRQRVDRPRLIPNYLRLRGKPEDTWPDDVRKYVGQLRGQVATLATSSGASVLVDSSKSPAGLALAMLAFGSRVTALQVVRDPRAVAYSQSRRRFATGGVHGDVPRAYRVGASVTLWRKMNVEGALTAHFATRHHVFAYESLRDQPRKRLEGLASSLGMAGESPGWVGNTVQLRKQHILAGNPNRAGQRNRAIEVADVQPDPFTRREQVLIKLGAQPFYRYWELRARPRK